MQHSTFPSRHARKAMNSKTHARRGAILDEAPPSRAPPQSPTPRAPSEKSDPPGPAEKSAPPAPSDRDNRGHQDPVLQDLWERLDEFLTHSKNLTMAPSQATQKQPPVPPAGDFEDIAYMTDVKSDELDFRIEELKQAGMKPTSTYDRASSTLRRKELEYWRLKMTLEEKQATMKCETFLTMLASTIETVCRAMNIDVVCLDGLTEAVQQAISEGAFQRPIEYYVKTMGGGTGVMNTPFYAFISAFAVILIKTHVNGKVSNTKKTEASHGDEGLGPNMYNPAAMGDEPLRRGAGRDFPPDHSRPHIPRGPSAASYGKHEVSYSRVPSPRDGSSHQTEHVNAVPYLPQRHIGADDQGRSEIQYRETGLREVQMTESQDGVLSMVQQFRPMLQTYDTYEQKSNELSSTLRDLECQLPQPQPMD